jgi:hypothetical protein
MAGYQHAKDASYINELKDYMFTNECIYKNSNNSTKLNENKSKKINVTSKQVKNFVNTKKNNIDNFSPLEKDKLFWCFYVLHNGMENYEFIKTISFKTEKEFKFKTAEKIKDYKDTFKSLKIKLNNLQDEFVNEQTITLKGLVALCHMYNLNVLYIKKKTYYEILTNDTNKINLIVQTDKEIFIPLNVTDDMIMSYKNDYWKIENPNSPLKSISSYTLLELQNICHKLSIQTEKDKKRLIKQELYESILRTL